MSGRRKWFLIGGLGLLALVVVLFLSGVLPSSGAAQQPQQPATGETVTVTRGELAASASAGGHVMARREAALALPASGRVAAVFVQVGDEVAAGDPLVQLESSALERAVANAEQAVAIQRANLEQLQAGASAGDLAAAQAAVNSAQARLDDLLNGPSEQEIAAAEANLRAAQANVARASRQLSQAQAPADQGAILQAEAAVEDARLAVQEAERAHQRLLDCEQLENGEWVCEPGDIPFLSEEEEAELIRQAELRVVQARETLAAAQANLNQLQGGGSESVVGASQASVAQMAARRDAAQANLDLLLAGPTAAEIAAARSDLTEVEASLARLQAGPGEAELAAAEAGLAQAELALQRAQNNLEDATLRAPFSGIVTAVRVSEGEMASGVAVELVDTASLQVALDVDEVDVGLLEVGQEATVTLEPWPDEVLQSEVVAISPVSNAGLQREAALNSSIASFRVWLSLPETDLAIRPGMTADANLQTARRENVLLVPNRAIIADRQAGEFYVNRVVTGADGREQLERTEVTIGLRDNRYTEVTSGLSEGDRVRIGPLVQQQNLLTPQPSGGGPFGG